MVWHGPLLGIRSRQRASYFLSYLVPCLLLRGGGEGAKTNKQANKQTPLLSKLAAHQKHSPLLREELQNALFKLLCKCRCENIKKCGRNMDYVLKASKRTVLAGDLQLSVESFACSWEEAKLQAERIVYFSLSLSISLFFFSSLPLSLSPSLPSIFSSLSLSLSSKLLELLKQLKAQIQQTWHGIISYLLYPNIIIEVIQMLYVSAKWSYSGEKIKQSVCTVG